MAGFIENLLTDAAAGFFGNDYLRDFTHASKTFRSDAYSFSPKFKFLFHVYFNLNQNLISTIGDNLIKEGKLLNFGLAVKNIQLPKYTFDLHDMNQYNRKRIVQSKIKYDPVTINFHDDNAGVIKKLWYTYYTYYYKDATQKDSNLRTPKSRNNTPPTNPNGSQSGDISRRNIYDNSISGTADWGYIGEASSTPQTALAASVGQTKAPFFRSIDVYGFNQHSFTLYRLINPVIESFGHDTYDYSQANGTMENTMSLRYETVKYYEGGLDGKKPDEIVFGFGDVANYDRTLSPIARPGSQSTIIGPGGLLSAAGGFMDDLEDGNILGAVQKAGTAYNTFKNPQSILKAAKNDVIGEVTGAITGAPNRNSIFNFPVFDSTPVKNLGSFNIQNATNAANKFLSSPPAVK